MSARWRGRQNDDVDADAIERVVAGPLRRAASDLDELSAARLGAAIESRLGAGGRAPPHGGGRRRARVVAAAAGSIALGVVAAVALFSGARRASPVAGPPAVARVFAPYLYTGPGARAVPLRPSDRLVVPAGGTLRVGLGKRGRLALVGPGSLTAAEAAGVTELHLDGGLLLVDWTGEHGTTLRVRSTDALVTVIGTLFAVDARATRTRVAVMRGTVEVSAATVARQVAAGRAWTVGEPELGAPPAELEAALAEHAGVAPAGTPASRAPLTPPAAAPAADEAAAPARIRAPHEPRWSATARAALDPAITGTLPPAAGASANDAETMYIAAEKLMRAGSTDEACAVLRDLLARNGSDPRAEPARLDLARLALAAGRPDEARQALAGLPDPTHDLALTEQARHLRCRIEVVAGAKAEAARCLRAFRQQHPRSPHDAEALAQLSALAAGCAEARPLLDEYLRRYPDGPYTARATARLASCR